MDDSNDLHMCGVCRDVFLDIELFLEHKRKCVPSESDKGFSSIDQNIDILENAVITSEDSGPMLDLTALSGGTFPLILQYNNEEVVGDKSPVQLLETDLEDYQENHEKDLEDYGENQINKTLNRSEVDKEDATFSVNHSNREDLANLFVPCLSEEVMNNSSGSLLNQDSDRCSAFFSSDNEDNLNIRNFTVEEQDFCKDIGEETVLSNSKNKKYTCNICNFETPKAVDLKRHTRKHTGEKPFKCNICGKSFARQDKVKEHTRIHTGDKRFKCQLCEYRSTDGGALRRHLQIHTDERPHKCQICSYSARTSSHMILHLRTHTGDSPFFCQLETCGRTFKTSTDLKRHMKVHKKDKPYSSFKDVPEIISCKEFSKCGKLSSKPSSCYTCHDYVNKSTKEVRRRHSRKRRGKRVRCTKEHQCPDCSAAFVRLDSLRSHMRLHRQDSPSFGAERNLAGETEEELEKENMSTSSGLAAPSDIAASELEYIDSSGYLEDNLIALDQDGTIHSIVNTALL